MQSELVAFSANMNRAAVESNAIFDRHMTVVREALTVCPPCPARSVNPPGPSPSYHARQPPDYCHCIYGGSR
jgi:hypothetical protein